MPHERRTEHPPHLVPPGTLVDLDALDPGSTGGYPDKHAAREELAGHRERIRDLQTRLYAEHRRALLIVLQAMDTGGKDGTIRSVFEGVNPQGCQVTSFKTPSAEELDHDFLWRYHRHAPARGMIGIFNRSHYEDVLIVRVRSLVEERVWRGRYALINDFERLLAAEGVTVLKFFLHISRDEQRRRLEARLAEPHKRWKFSAGDLAERARWDDYRRAYADAIGACSTAGAPWYVVPADHKWYRNLVVARTIADTLEALDPRYPPPPADLDGIVVPG